MKELHACTVGVLLSPNACVSGEAAMLYSDLASSCESGWDFSSRWLATDGHDKNELKSSRTRDIIPVDLNALLCWNENIMARFYGILGKAGMNVETMYGVCMHVLTRAIQHYNSNAMQCF